MSRLNYFFFFKDQLDSKDIVCLENRVRLLYQDLYFSTAVPDIQRYKAKMTAIRLTFIFVVGFFCL